MRKIIASILVVICVLALAACQTEPQNSDGIFYMEYNGVKIELGAKADSIISALGQAKSVKELGDCGGLGAQVKYTYDDVELYTLKDSKGETVDQIEFISDLVSTSKGISLGDSQAKVIEAYGQPQKQDDREIVYTKDNMNLKFKLEGGNVSAIDYIRVTR